MIKVGITGGIGSGKTTICKVFQSLGIPIYQADDAAKWLMQNNAELITAIKQAFGEEVYKEQNQLNRQQLAAIVFNNADALKKLNSLVHPAVHQHSETWMKEQAANKVPYTLKEAALIFESGSYKLLDKVITVFAPQHIRLQRVVKRDKSTPEQVLARMEKQMSEIEKINLADYIIINDGEEMLLPQIYSIHQALSQLASS